MESLINQGLLGIITGILTTVILYVIKVFWCTKVTPYLKSVRYQGVKIDGKWSGHDFNDDENEGDIFNTEFTLFLNQNAHQLSGSFFFKFKNDKKDFALDFEVTGYIWEGYVTLNFTPKDKRVTSYATTLLKLHDGGQSLIGVLLFRNVETEFVSQVPLVLLRNPDGS